MDDFGEIVIAAIVIALIVCSPLIVVCIAQAVSTSEHEVVCQVIEVNGDDFDQRLVVLCGKEVIHGVKCCRNLDVVVGNQVNVSYKSAWLNPDWGFKAKC